MKEPRPGRNPSVIRFASPSGKYAVPPISSRTVAEGLKILVVLSTRLCSTSVISHLSITSRSKGQTLSLLGLMAKIKCSICSYQFNIWYAGHRPAHILIWFLAFGQGSEACFTLTTGCLGIALQPSAAHYLTNEMHQNSALVMVILRLSDMAILRHCGIATLRYCRLKFYLFQISEKTSSFLNFM